MWTERTRHDVVFLRIKIKPKWQLEVKNDECNVDWLPAADGSGITKLSETWPARMDNRVSPASGLDLHLHHMGQNKKCAAPADLAPDVQKAAAETSPSRVELCLRDV